MPQPTITLAPRSLIQCIASEHLLYTWFGDEPGLWAGAPGEDSLAKGEHCWSLSIAGHSSGARTKCRESSLSSRDHRHVGDPKQHGSPGQQQRKQLMVEF